MTGQIHAALWQAAVRSPRLGLIVGETGGWRASVHHMQGATSIFFASDEALLRACVRARVRVCIIVYIISKSVKGRTASNLC